MSVFVKKTVVVTAANAPLARALSEGIAGPSGSNMFQRGLSATGAPPATHYASSGWLWDTYVALMTDADAMFAAAQQAGSAVTLAECQALVNESDISDALVETPEAAFARLGLVMVQEAM